MKKCDGCGSILQNEKPTSEGYVADLSKNLCERCFRIRHYNEYRKINKDNRYYLDIINKIEKTDDLVVLVTDFLNLDLLIDIKNPVILVLAKRDLIPRSIDEQKLLSSIKSNLNIVAKIVVCSKTNYNLDLLYEQINKHKKSNNVYVIGYTNAGKSTLINKIIKNYSAKEKYITTSNLPSTTLDLIENKINDNLVIIDTPGLLDTGSIILTADEKLLKKITPKKEIKPVTIQVKTKQSIIIENILRMDVENETNLVFYLSNDLKIERYYKDSNKLCTLKKHQISVEKGNDIVIKGLGFIKVTHNTNIILYLDENIKYMVRQSII
ncbi:MAG: 50S ribosome-binding GTPase [Bacilli bacterium]|nr:50S ribosome-binding GTPase [Bacilli bacterium]